MNRYLYPTFDRPVQYGFSIGDRVKFEYKAFNWDTEYGVVTGIDGDIVQVHWDDGKKNETFAKNISHE